jgi:O-antigen/teichoic acid export membrane protein
MIVLKEKVKAWLGPLWWYAALMFIVQRIGDVINAFIGLWLVPKYVPQAELGAVMPLAQVGSVMALPLSILLVPFMKFLNTYATRGEYGKVKRLLSDVFVLSFLLFICTVLYARFFMPLVFERMRVAEGSLGLLIVASGVIGTVSTVFTNALQALKRFRLITAINLLAPPLRLCTLLVFMPIRALSGYFVGQIVPSLCLILVSLFGLRGQFGKQVRSEPYWVKDWRPIVRYTVPVAVMALAGTVQVTVETFIIRHRLPEIESAAYYIISRFAEMGCYGGLAIMFVFFPIVAERHEQGGRTGHFLLQSLLISLGLGIVLAFAFYLGGDWLLGLSPTWRDYRSYDRALVVLTLMHALRTSTQCFIYHEMACNRFKFVGYLCAVSIMESVLLYGLTGYAFFKPYVSPVLYDWMASLNASRMSFVLTTMILSSLVAFVCILAHVGVRHYVGVRPQRA